MSANDVQVGGSHYKQKDGAEQHWDRQWRLYGAGYFVGCITKYVERYHAKNGIQDLEKAQHFLSKLIELESAKPKVEQPVGKIGGTNMGVSSTDMRGSNSAMRGISAVVGPTGECYDGSDPLGRGYVNQD